MPARTEIDVIFLSYANTESLKKLTEQSITTLLASEDPEKIKFNIVVIESNLEMAPYQFENSTTIYPSEKFGYHKYLNIGIRLTSNPYVCLCNNDLIFHKNWATEIVRAMDNDPKLLSATPYCPYFHEREGFKKNSPPLEGYYGALIGWCQFVKREVLNTIGPLDEKLTFWYCDHDFSNTLQKHNIKNCLISTSFVTHLGSQTIIDTDKKEYEKLTQLPRMYFSYKWQHHSYLKYLLQVFVFKLKLLLNR